MKNSKTPKIVVGVGIIAVYSGLALYMLRDAPDSNVAQNATTAPAAQMDAASVPLPAVAPSLTEPSTSVAEQPAVVTESPSPVARATANSVRTPAPQAERVEPKVQVKEQAIAREQMIASAGDDSASLAGGAPLSGQAEVAPSGNDSQITADVKTQIAAVAPAGTIAVTTTDGVVELSGSVPSEEEIDKVLLAARNVAHVRSVDASALMVSN